MFYGGGDYTPNDNFILFLSHWNSTMQLLGTVKQREIIALQDRKVFFDEISCKVITNFSLIKLQDYSIKNIFVAFSLFTEFFLHVLMGINLSSNVTRSTGSSGIEGTERRNRFVDSI